MTLQQQVRSNRFRSAIVVVGFALLLLAVAGLIGLAFDLSLGVVALAGAALYGVFALWRSRSMVAGLTRAHDVDPHELVPLRRLVENVSIGAGLPVIAAGGVSSLGEIRAVRELGCEGAVAGSALWLGRFALEEAVSLQA